MSTLISSLSMIKRCIFTCEVDESQYLTIISITKINNANIRKTSSKRKIRTSCTGAWSEWGKTAWYASSIPLLSLIVFQHKHNCSLLHPG